MSSSCSQPPRLMLAMRSVVLTMTHSPSIASGSVFIGGGVILVDVLVGIAEARFLSCEREYTRQR
jgi:hypothetical protein